MKYLFAAFAGLVLGAALGAGALYYNPLTRREASTFDDPDFTLRYSLPQDDLIALTHSERAPLPFKPQGVGKLWESAISGAALGVLALEGPESDRVAFATRLSVPSRATDLLLRGALVDDYWLVTVPGGGSVFVQDRNNLWPAVRENVLPVSLLGRPWHGPSAYRTSVGPGADKAGVAVGATGRFAGMQGSAAERYHLQRYSRAHGAEELDGELALRVARPAPADAGEPAAADESAGAGTAPSEAAAAPAENEEPGA
jgi:hypothetical protein